MADGMARSERVSRAMGQASEAAKVVGELRHARPEELAGNAAAYAENWQGRRAALLEIAQDEVLGGAFFREQVERTGMLIDKATVAASQPARAAEASAREIAAEAALVWVRWHRVEAGLNNRLMVELAGPQEKWPAAAALAALACLASALLLWRTWQTGQARRETRVLETSLRDSEGRARAMLESAREILLQAEPGGRILRSNRPLAAAGLRELFREEGAWEAILSGAAQAGTAAIVIDGSERRVEWRARAVRDPGGELARIDLALLDVTEWHHERETAEARQARLERTCGKLEGQSRELLRQSFELAESRAAVERTSEARLEAMAQWSRQATAPLGHAARLAAGLPGPEAASIEREIQAVAASLRGLAELAGSFDGELESCSPRALMEDAAERGAARAEAKGIEMPCLVPAETPAQVLVPVRLLRQVLDGLVEQAVAQTACGEVSLRLTVVRRQGAAVDLQIEVEDSGAGFAPEEFAALLEPFHPGVPAPAGASALAVAKRQVEKLGGQFGGQSEPGQGTRIWMLFPATLDAENAAAKPAPVWAGRRLLVVEEAASVRGALVELAASLGLGAEAVADAEAARLRLREAAATAAPFSYVLAARESSGLAADVPVFTMLPPSMAPAPAGAVLKPVRQAALRRLLERQEEPAPDRPPARILIVEDNAVNRRVAVRMVEKMGCVAVLARDGRQALEAVQREPFDLILMDCQMPEMDGFTATAQIRALDGPAGRTPIIAMTANAMAGDRELCLAAGMDDYLSKPVSFETLETLVKQRLGEREKAAQ